jgi:hypothetical protein
MVGVDVKVDGPSVVWFHQRAKFQVDGGGPRYRALHLTIQRMGASVGSAGAGMAGMIVGDIGSQTERIPWSRSGSPRYPDLTGLLGSNIILLQAPSALIEMTTFASHVGSNKRLQSSQEIVSNLGCCSWCLGAV